MGTDEAPIDNSQETINEEYMWNLADQTSWDPIQSSQLVFVESAIAMPPVALCMECEEEGKHFSKSQLARRVDQRRCQECVTKALREVMGSSTSLCSVCHTQLSTANCSKSQRKKPTGRRKCNTCAAATGAVLAPSVGNVHEDPVAATATAGSGVQVRLPPNVCCLC